MIQPKLPDPWLIGLRESQRPSSKSLNAPILKDDITPWASANNAICSSSVSINWPPSANTPSSSHTPEASAKGAIKNGTTSLSADSKKPNNPKA